MRTDRNYALGASAAYADATAERMRAAADRYQSDGYYTLAAFLRDQARAQEWTRVY
jgi:uncharacterized membrane-anchored protein